MFKILGQIRKKKNCVELAVKQNAMLSILSFFIDFVMHT